MTALHNSLREMYNLQISGRIALLFITTFNHRQYHFKPLIGVNAVGTVSRNNHAFASP